MTNPAGKAGLRPRSGVPTEAPDLAMSELMQEVWSPAIAARAAKERALSCRRRIEALRAELPFDGSEAERAKESLRRARQRAAAAELRRRERATIAAAQLATRPAGAVEIWERPDNMAVRLAEHRVTVRTLFERYFSLGGQCPLFDVDAHVHGFAALPADERKVLEHAFWELIELTAD
jgi:hypothetical protein